MKTEVLAALLTATAQGNIDDGLDSWACNICNAETVDLTQSTSPSIYPGSQSATTLQPSKAARKTAPLEVIELVDSDDDDDDALQALGNPPLSTGNSGASITPSTSLDATGNATGRAASVASQFLDLSLASDTSTPVSTSTSRSNPHSRDLLATSRPTPVTPATSGTSPSSPISRNYTPPPLPPVYAVPVQPNGEPDFRALIADMRKQGKLNPSLSERYTSALLLDAKPTTTTTASSGATRLRGEFEEEDPHDIEDMYASVPPPVQRHRSTGIPGPSTPAPTPTVPVKLEAHDDDDAALLPILGSTPSTAAAKTQPNPDPPIGTFLTWFNDRQEEKDRGERESDRWDDMFAGRERRRRESGSVASRRKTQETTMVKGRERRRRDKDGLVWCAPVSYPVSYPVDIRKSANWRLGLDVLDRLAGR
ncbi:hypothetical protein EW026_g5621 [Hermanssonia centrifuga]|uniref:Uncharacterized protein n=1 Tax=Hermanssonia centrifuga TaxID=98765 RepID=A0A4S4KDT8_9APHY|nr:hypothetical protein EW026_g5621 [Hermanssonia centrifuga]